MTWDKYFIMGGIQVSGSITLAGSRNHGITISKNDEPFMYVRDHAELVTCLRAAKEYTFEQGDFEEWSLINYLVAKLSEPFDIS